MLPVFEKLRTDAIYTTVFFKGIDNESLVSRFAFPITNNLFRSKLSGLATTVVQSAFPPPPRLQFHRSLSAQPSSLSVIKFGWLASCCTERHGTTLPFNTFDVFCAAATCVLFITNKLSCLFVTGDCFMCSNLLESKWAAIAQSV
jgi:hypothetical protein